MTLTSRNLARPRSQPSCFLDLTRNGEKVYDLDTVAYLGPSEAYMLQEEILIEPLRKKWSLERHFMVAVGGSKVGWLQGTFSDDVLVARFAVVSEC